MTNQEAIEILSEMGMTDQEAIEILSELKSRTTYSTRAERGDAVKCTKVNCPMQAGTPTDNCGKNCPWRTTAKTGDLVSRAAVIEAILGSFNAIRAIEELHAVDAVPVVHGQWIDIPDKPEWDQKMCSICGDYFCCQGNYCPNCGAKMDDEWRDDNTAKVEIERLRRRDNG